MHDIKGVEATGESVLLAEEQSIKNIAVMIHSRPAEAGTKSHSRTHSICCGISVKCAVCVLCEARTARAASLLTWPFRNADSNSVLCLADCLNIDVHRVRCGNVSGSGSFTVSGRSIANRPHSSAKAPNTRYGIGSPNLFWKKDQNTPKVNMSSTDHRVEFSRDWFCLFFLIRLIFPRSCEKQFNKELKYFAEYLSSESNYIHFLSSHLRNWAVHVSFLPLLKDRRISCKGATSD